MTRHPDAGVLAEFREGLLGRRRAARIRAHLAGCPRCASLDSGLAEVSQLLASSPAPSMPEHLAARLDSALAAEAARRPQAGDATTAGQGDGAAGTRLAGVAAGPDGQPGSSPPPGHRRHPARSRRLARVRPAVLGAAAAAMIVVAGIGYGLASLAHSPGGTSASSGSAAGPNEPHPSHGAVNPPAEGPASAASGTPLRVIDSGTDYQPGTFARQAAAVLAGHRAAPAGQMQQAVTSRMRACVTLITGGRTPRLVDAARYQGRPATIIVTAPSAARPGRVWVAGAACSAQDRDLLAQASLPRSG